MGGWVTDIVSSSLGPSDYPAVSASIPPNGIHSRALREPQEELSANLAIPLLRRSMRRSNNA